MSLIDKNLDALMYHLNEKIIYEISHASTDKVFIKPSKLSDHMTLSFETENGEEIYIHSKYDPEKEAKKIVEAVPEHSNADVIFCLGFGLGYHIEYLRRKIKDNARVIVIDTNLSILRKVLSEKDFTELFNDRRFIFLFCNDNMLNNQISNLVNSLNGIILHNAPVIFLQPMERITPNFFVKIVNAYQLAGKNFWQNIGNDPDDTLMGFEHTFHNMNHILKSYSLKKLKDYYKGVPAFCVAAGPSLEKNIHQLKRINQNAIIISCDAALERLKREGIQPHFVTSMERTEIVYNKFYKDKELNPNTILVGLNVLLKKVFEEYPGKKIIAGRSTTPFEVKLAEFLTNFSLINGGSSVAHMAYSLAKEMGCEPIVLVGQDLAYGEDGSTHVKGIKDPIAEEYRNNAMSNGSGIYVEGIDGKPVLTNLTWSRFLEWFEIDIQKTDKLVIDASEGGAKINGTEIKSLQEVLDQYLSEKKITDPNALLDKEDIGSELIEQNLTKLINYCEEEVQKINNVYELIKGLKKEIKIIEEAILKKDIDRISKHLSIFEDIFDAIPPISYMFTFSVQYLIYKHYEYANKNEFESFAQLSSLISYMKELAEKYEDVNRKLYRLFNHFISQQKEFQIK